ncbi:MAG: hypothetical protein DLM55_10165 [Acidimicrobiales bacterium]|nr:MAG: hypothetical protein DLM55_10165 [Acidimicrobiales bacterium]
MSRRLQATNSDAELVDVSVAQRWLDHHGQQARAWLDEAPGIAQSWARKWHFTVEAPLAGGSVSVVLSVKRAGTPAVLKLAPPWSRWSQEEAAALRAWDGHGAAALLAASDDARALLLERVWPGTPADSRTAEDLATLLTKLSRPAVPPGMPSLADALKLRFDRAAENRHGLLSLEQLERARRDAIDLAQTLQGQPLLCHGDLQSKNILLSSDRDLLVIDPNPCAGQPVYDAALWALTQLPIPAAPERTATIAALLGLPENEVLRWVILLAAVEVCLASLDRAEAYLELAEHLNAEWLRDVRGH